MLKHVSLDGQCNDLNYFNQIRLTSTLACSLRPRLKHVIVNVGGANTADLRHNFRLVSLIDPMDSDRA